MPFSCLIVPLALSGLAHAQVAPAEVVRRSDALIASATSVQGSYALTSNGGGASVVQFALDQPDALVFRSASKVEVFDGRTHTIANLAARTYEQRNPLVYGTPFLIGYQRFIRPGVSKQTVRYLTYGPPSYVEVGGRPYVRHVSGSGDRTITVDIDPTTSLPARWRWQTGAAVYEAVFGEVTLNQPVPNSLFDVPALTTGFTLVPTAEERLLPAIGVKGANVQGKTVQGREFDLLSNSATRRATVVVFVNPADGNSVNAARSIGGTVGRRRDVQVVYVSSAGDRETQKFLRDSRSSNPCLTGEAASEAISAYGVKLYPTVVVLDSTGTVTARMLGYDGTAFTTAISAPGVDGAQPN